MSEQDLITDPNWGSSASAKMPPPGVTTRDQWDVRPDGSKKGLGFLGVLRVPGTDDVASEYSIADSEKLKDAKGNYLDYPALVPTLTKTEVQQVLDAAKHHRPVPAPVAAKAEAFALQRRAEGKPLFAQDGEQQLLFPDLPRATVEAGGGRDTKTSGSSDVITDVNWGGDAKMTLPSSRDEQTPPAARPSLPMLQLPDVRLPKEVEQARGTPIVLDPNAPPGRNAGDAWRQFNAPLYDTGHPNVDWLSSPAGVTSLVGSLVTVGTAGVVAGLPAAVRAGLSEASPYVVSIAVSEGLDAMGLGKWKTPILVALGIRQLAKAGKAGGAASSPESAAAKAAAAEEAAAAKAYVKAQAEAPVQGPTEFKDLSLAQQEPYLPTQGPTPVTTRTSPAPYQASPTPFHELPLAQQMEMLPSHGPTPVTTRSSGPPATIGGVMTQAAVPFHELPLAQQMEMLPSHGPTPVTTRSSGPPMRIGDFTSAPTATPFHELPLAQQMEMLPSHGPTPETTRTSGPPARGADGRFQADTTPPAAAPPAGTPGGVPRHLAFPFEGKGSLPSAERLKKLFPEGLSARETAFLDQMVNRAGASGGQAVRALQNAKKAGDYSDVDLINGLAQFLADIKR
ncbi:MAG TPA: hypothetical protein VKE96_12455 [Vicinamibacterales bacterium]|nr:hypothetical protein [Vicinamibacterales bacterium]